VVEQKIGRRIGEEGLAAGMKRVSAGDGKGKRKPTPAGVERRYGPG
jgi:hypothetical protein